MAVNQKRRQRGLRKLAAALRILRNEEIIPAGGYPVVMVNIDGSTTEFMPNEKGEFGWIDKPNADFEAQRLYEQEMASE